MQLSVSFTIDAIHRPTTLKNLSQLLFFANKEKVPHPVIVLILGYSMLSRYMSLTTTPLTNFHIPTNSNALGALNSLLPLPVGAFHGQRNNGPEQQQQQQQQQQLLRIPTGQRQTSCVFTSTAGKLNQGLTTRIKFNKGSERVLNPGSKRANHWFQRAYENNGVCKIWRANKLHYRECKNGQLEMFYSLTL